MAQSQDILGMNARQQVYTRMNSKRARSYAFSKLAAKKLLAKNGVQVPELFAKFKENEQVREFNFSQIEASFVIKPAGGNAGKGIMIVKRKVKNEEDKWVDINGQILTSGDLKLHVSDILEGQYSTYGTQHIAFVEERVVVHPKLKRYVKRGTPDVRVVVFNRVPVMAMLRLPTEESEGRANLHQGAIGVGIDIASGVTLAGIYKNKKMRYLPGTKRKLNGIRIPKWTSLLKTAVSAAEVAGLTYCGVDLFLHRDKGPMVVELNANPGLSIQMANDSGLRRRLERVVGLKIRNIDHGVRVGRALFAEWFADKVKAEDGLTVIDTFEVVKLRSSNKKWIDVEAKVDTGAFRTAVDRDLAASLGLLGEDNVLWEGRFRHSYGREKRPVVEVVLKIKDKKLKTAASIANRSKMKAKVLIGRRDLRGFLVNPQLKRELD